MTGLLVTLLLSQAPYRLVDLDTTPKPPRDSAPRYFVSTGTTAFFWANDFAHGSELWVTDGTDAGTRLVVDFSPGDYSTSPTPMLALDAGVVLVRAATRLYVSDGTPAGTRFRCCATMSIEGFAALPNGGVVLDVDSKSLALLDSSAEGATPVAPVEVSTFLGHTGGKLIFTGTSLASSTDGLWATDGVTAEQLIPMLERSTSLAVVNGVGYTWGRTSFSSPTYLFRTDGTVAGTSNAGTFSGVNAKVVGTGDLLFFDGQGELYAANTAATPITFPLIADLNPGSPTSDPDEMVAFGSGVLFQARDGTSGYEPWFVSGVDGGVVRLVDANPGGSSSLPVGFTPNGARALFSTTGGPSAVWVTDGTPAGTAALTPGSAQSSTSGHAAAFGSGWLFESDIGGDTDPWISDGTPAGTHKLKAISRNALNYGSVPEDFTSVGFKVTFRAGSTTAGTEMFALDVIDGGVALLADLCVGPCESAYETLGVLNGRVYFGAWDDNAGEEVFSTRGVPGDVQLLANLMPGQGSSTPRQGLVTGGNLYFVAEDPLKGRELWRTDGTVAGTSVAAEVVVGATSSYPYMLTALSDGGVLFIAESSPVDAYLYRANPGLPPTRLFGDYPYEMVALGDRVYLADMCGAPYGCELWSTDGTIAGTTIAADLDMGGSGNPSGLAVQGGRLYFFGDDGTDTSLYVTAPSMSGAQRVFNFGPGPGVATGQVFAGANGVFFSATTPDAGAEPWFSDGTQAGTVMLKDIWPGPDGSDPGQDPYSTLTPDLWVTSGQRTFFAASDPAHGRELWVSDGTPSGTRLFADVVPGPASSSPRELHAALGYLFFGAVDETGSEPWVLPLAEGPPRIDKQIDGQTGGDGGWYVTDVTVTFSVTTGDVPVLTSTGCGLGQQPFDGGFTGRVVVTDDGDLVLPCAARTSGGETSITVPVRRDAHAPTLTCPDDLTADAMGPGGTVVTFATPAATDAVDAAPVVTVTPPAGSAFPVGRSLVTVTATDHVGNTNACRFYVVVRDGSAPSLTCPMDVTVDATGPDGAAVDYAAMVTDAIDPMPRLVYSAAPLSVFPPGRSGVSVLAVDAAGNLASCGFVVTVVGLPDAGGGGGQVNGGCGCHSGLEALMGLALAVLARMRRRPR